MARERSGVDQLSYYLSDVEPADQIARSVLFPQLYEILELSGSIQRFDRLGLPNQAIADETVKVHTLRLVMRAQDLPIHDSKIQLITKTLLIHDLPETANLIRSRKTSDTTSPEKYNDHQLEQLVEREEIFIAREIFSEHELDLYLKFNNAGNFLKGKVDHTPTQEALISKILDKIDGDLFFHKTAALNANQPPDLDGRGQSLAFEQYPKFSERLSSLNDTKASEAAVLCQLLLDECINEIRNIWSTVDPENIPLIIAQNL